MSLANLDTGRTFTKPTGAYTAGGVQGTSGWVQEFLVSAHQKPLLGGDKAEESRFGITSGAFRYIGQTFSTQQIAPKENWNHKNEL